MWRGEGYTEIGEAGDPIKEFKIRGAKKLVFTGGEPLLRDDLLVLLKKARQYGLTTELITNGLLYNERAKELAGSVDRLFFSLDYPIASEHDRSRGVDCYSQVILAIKKAQELGERPIINFTLTRDSIRFLPEMFELAERLKVFLNLNPVYDYFGTQGFTPESLDHARYYGRRKNVLVNLAVLEFIRSGGNRVLYPRCRALETTITALPNGQIVRPCFFNPEGKEGREPVCSSCMRWPYMLPSFSIGVDKYFWLNLYSDWLEKYKMRRVKL